MIIIVVMPAPVSFASRDTCLRVLH